MEKKWFFRLSEDAKIIKVYCFYNSVCNYIFQCLYYVFRMFTVFIMFSI